MKFCPNCGREVNDSETKCPDCGTNIGEVSNKGTVGNSNTNTGNIQNNSPVKKSKKKWIIGIIVALLVVIAGITTAVILKKTSKKDVKIADYIEVTYSGYSGYASAEVSIDTDKLYELVYGKNSKNTLSLSKEQKVYDLKDAISFSSDCEGKNDLKNGDKITVTFNVEKSVFKNNGYNANTSKKVVEVTGLEEINEVDLFDEVDIKLAGTLPNDLEVEVQNNSKDQYISSIKFRISDGENEVYKEGDKVTVEALTDEVTAMNQGYKFKSLTKEIEIKDVNTYLFNATDVADDGVSELKTKAESCIANYFSGYPDYKYDTPKYLGIYVFRLKDSETNPWVNEYNDVYLIYSVNVSAADGSFPAKTVYMPIELSNVEMTPDKKLTTTDEKLTQFAIQGNCTIYEAGILTTKKCYGYLSMAEAESDITKGVTDFDITKNGTFQ